MAEPHPLLADRYRLVRQVGSGGMGVVWEAWDERLERPVAIKQLKPQLGLTPEEAELAKNRAMREARITARLHHRNAVPVFDVVEADGQPCLVMQFLPSVPLSAMLRESGPLGVRAAARVGAQVASALAAAHQLGIVHRDVKPGNVLIGDDGTALISDFGISHALGDATLTSTGLVHGTPAYLAPEVARGAESGFASDVFSLGATLYACLEGSPPFGTDPNSIALLHKVASGQFDPPQHAGALAGVVTAMLASDPDARPSMKDVATRLAAVEAEGERSPTTQPMAAPVVTRAPVAAVPPESTTTTQVRQDAGPPTFAAAAARTAVPVAATAALPERLASPPSPPSPPDPALPDPAPPRRRRGGWVVLAVLLVALVVGGFLLAGQLGLGGGSAADPAASTSAGRPKASKASSSSSTTKASSSASSSSSRSPSGSPSSSPSGSGTPSPSASPTPTSSSGEPTAAELEDAITGYYALVPGNTDAAWPRLTSAYQRRTAGGKKAYENFWSGFSRVSVSDVKASPPSQVEAVVTYRRTNGSTSVERTRFRLVRDGGILKIDGSTVVSNS